MLPIAPLMIEHRLIDRMIAVIRKEILRIERDGKVDPLFIDTVTDFIHTYADRCHHGKEEDILFRDLGKKNLTVRDREAMDDLMADHQTGRRTVVELLAARERYMGGEQDQAALVLEHLRFFVHFYPKHIEKEDKRFFIPVMSYFNEDEKQAMLNEERAFDRDLIHTIYREKVLKAEAEPTR
jgi:hemerythrin-like domain-containing protein